MSQRRASTPSGYLGRAAIRTSGKNESCAKGGQMRWKGQDIRLSEALWGQQVGFEPIGDGIWNVHFEALYLGVFDERKARIQRRETL